MLIHWFLACSSPSPTPPVDTGSNAHTPIDVVDQITPEIDQSEADDTGDDADDTGVSDDTGSPATPLVFGTWSAEIKDWSNRSDAAHCSDGGWYSNDAPAMVDALQASGQTLYVGYVGDGDTSDCWWWNFDDLLDTVTADDGITLVAGIDWSATPEEAVAAMHALRDRVTDHPELKALVIDDFHANPPDARWPVAQWTFDEVVAVYAAAHDTDCDDAWCSLPEVEFWPYFMADTVGSWVVPGYWLGVHGCSSCSNPDEYTMYAASDGPDGSLYGDSASLTWTWEGGAGSLDILRFLFTDKYVQSSAHGPSPRLSLLVDGVEVDSWSLANDTSSARGNGIESVERALGDHVTLDGEHQITLVVSAPDGDVDAEDAKLVSIWGLEVDTSGVRTPIDPSRISVEASRDPNRSLSVEDAVLAASNEPWRLTEHFDAVLLQTGPKPTDWDVDVIAHTTEQACRTLHDVGKGCWMVQWGNDQWAVSQDPDIEVERIRLVEGVADGVIVYRFPIDMVGGSMVDGLFVPPDQGVHTDLEPLDPDSYDIMGYWPLYTRGIPGWTQSWAQVLPCDGSYTLHWSDNDKSGRKFRKTAVLDGVVILDALIDTDDSEGEVVFEALAGGRLTVGFTEEQSVGNAEYIAQFRLTADDSGCATEPLVDWEHRAGVDSDLVDLYTALVGVFTEESP